ncbi:MFS transporter [Amycolatopsis sp. FDAARGOS 1241]|uniref:MFS transporter n=1 Tax=Amycolatopsis sp. FDAARGOS 1241 TaxID=2778070 RepID=UPI001EF22A9B|nr:MFS transporter [Amycolatopsis sp. FDAARGOS 1241]
MPSTLLVALDIGVVLLALPAIAVDLGARGVQQLWLTDSYGFLIAGFLITMGTLGDRIGRRKLLLIGAAAFGVLSVVAAFAPDAGTLIVTRALLGVAGATLMPSTLAMISSLFPTRSSAARRSRCGRSASPAEPRSGPRSTGCCSRTSGGVRCSCSARR